MEVRNGLSLRPIRVRRLILATNLLVSLLVLSWDTSLSYAVPHTVASSDHPYDSDWPDVYLILMNKCSGCHRPNTEQVDLTDYDVFIEALTKDGEHVISPGRPGDSALWNYVAWNAKAELDSPYSSSPMMPDDKNEWLTAGQLEIVERWIHRGALQYKLPATCSTKPLMEIDYPSARQCKSCHPKQYEEWSRSMHHYAQHSPIFEAFNLTLQERTSGTLGTFCSRCHTPIGTALGENGLRRNVHRSQIAMEGVTCVACHRVKGKHYKSSGRQALQPGALMDTCMMGPFDDPASAGGSHPAQGSPYLKSAAFCGSCHDVTGPSGVRLEEAFSEWQNSPAAECGQNCQSCHMGPIPGIPIPDHERPLGRAAVVPGVDPSLLPLRRLSNHTFAGPDYSLLPDTEFPNQLDWMYETDYRNGANLTPFQQKTLNDLRRANRKSLRIASDQRYQLLRNAARISLTAPRDAKPGKTVKLRVEVTSTTAGHSFPTGFTAERQAWIQITVLDPRGQPIFCSGDTDKNGDLRDEHSHAVETGKINRDKYLLNFQNKFVALSSIGTERSVVLSVNRHLQPLNIVRPATGISASFGRPPTFRIAKGSLPPLATIGQTYPVTLTDPGAYRVDVRLNFRHLPPVLLDHLGTPHLKHLLETVVIDQRQTVIHVGYESLKANVPQTPATADAAALRYLTNRGRIGAAEERSKTKR
ncbi:MAG: multiheme c-type cytochrome [Pirellulales bacterium]